MVKVTCAACGNGFQTSAARLRAGRGKYCSRACASKRQKTTHGMWGTPTYWSWFAMKQRCQNQKSAKYPDYGAKGIRVCDEWQSFEHFYRDMGERPQGMTLDRMDQRRGYEPNNCRWATPLEQSSHLKTTRYVRYGAETLPISDLARRLGVQKNTLIYRIDAGWPQLHWGAKEWGGNRSRQGSVQI